MPVDVDRTTVSLLVICPTENKGEADAVLHIPERQIARCIGEGVSRIWDVIAVLSERGIFLLVSYYTK